MSCRQPDATNASANASSSIANLVEILTDQEFVDTSKLVDILEEFDKSGKIAKSLVPSVKREIETIFSKINDRVDELKKLKVEIVKNLNLI